MKQISSHSGQEIEEEIDLPAKFILHKNSKHPEIDGIKKDMEDISVKEHRGDQLPGILLSRDRQEITVDPEINIVINFLKGSKDDPVDKKEADRGPGKMFQI